MGVLLLKHTVLQGIKMKELAEKQGSQYRGGAADACEGGVGRGSGVGSADACARRHPHTDVARPEWGPQKQGDEGRAENAGGKQQPRL